MLKVLNKAKPGDILKFIPFRHLIRKTFDPTEQHDC